MILRDTVVEVDLRAIGANMDAICQMVGPDVAVMPVVKANAYGLGAVGVAPTLMEHGARYLAVATLSEAMELREAYADYPLFILGHTPDRLLGIVAENNITQTVFSKHQAKILGKAALALGKRAKVHLKVDTGFHRLGIDAQLMALTDACCSEDMFFARLVEDTLRDYPEEKNEQPTLFGKAVKPNWPAKQPSVVERGSAAITASAPKSKTDGEPVTAAASAYTAPAAESSTPRLFDEDLSLDWENEDDIEPEDEADSKPSVLIVLLIFLLAIVTLALVWVLVVKLMYLGILPKADFGFAEWFNAHLFRLY